MNNFIVSSIVIVSILTSFAIMKIGNKIAALNSLIKNIVECIKTHENQFKELARVVNNHFDMMQQQRETIIKLTKRIEQLENELERIKR